ncbi:MAG: excinuclease ABC subunit UvrC, partial [Candidatus Gracilibacteria bacterium]|nr:excinuclease ABC subunit UvrC [Candidatus Gracilibacteria bacterium]
MSEKNQKILSNLPHDPGVYIMKDKSGKIIYIGKSVNLKARVSSYFKVDANLNFAKKKMIEKIADIDYIVTKNEIEALILETNLIKKHLPKYNVLMKDDKNLLYVKITEDPIPEIIKTRKKTKDGTYFGPYTSQTNVTSILNALKKIFKIRNCRVKFDNVNGKLAVTHNAGKSIPCMDHYIGICSAPCLLEQSRIGEHNQNISSLKDFLSGKTGEIIKSLQEKMKQKSENLEFEEATKIKEQIKNISSLGAKQVARDTLEGDSDFVYLLSKYDKYFIGLLEVRDSYISGLFNITVQNKLEETDLEIITTFIEDHYVAYEGGKISLYVDLRIEKVLQEFLKTKKISIKKPLKEEEIELMNFVKGNALNFALKNEMGNIGKFSLTKNTQISLLQKLGFEVPKKQKQIIFECYDISHIAGNYTVASRSVIINGKSEPSKYRKYKLKTIEGGEIDDFKSLREVLGRRTKEAIKDNNWPDLIIIDGGIGQLSSAMNAIEEELKTVGNADLRSLQPSLPFSYPSLLDTKQSISPNHIDCHVIPLVSDKQEDCHEIFQISRNDERFPNICSIAKREEEIFLPGKKVSILLEKGSAELSLIQKIRDEAHRFAISFNRQAR